MSDKRFPRPSYYGGEDNPFEVIKIIEHYNLSFSAGNALKYLIRAGKKNSETQVEDLRKGMFYYNRELENAKAKDEPQKVDKAYIDISPVAEEIRETFEKDKEKYDLPVKRNPNFPLFQITPIDPFLEGSIGNVIRNSGEMLYGKFELNVSVGELAQRIVRMLRPTP